MQTAENWLEYCAGEMKRAGLFFGHGTDNAHDEAAWMLLHVLGQPLDGSFTRLGCRAHRGSTGTAQDTARAQDK